MQRLRYHLLNSPPPERLYVSSTTLRPRVAKPQATENGDDGDIVQRLRYKILPPPTPPAPNEIWPFKHPHHFNAANYESYALDHIPHETLEGSEETLGAEEKGGSKDEYNTKPTESTKPVTSAETSTQSRAPSSKVFYERVKYPSTAALPDSTAADGLYHPEEQKFEGNTDLDVNELEQHLSFGTKIAPKTTTPESATETGVTAATRSYAPSDAAANDMTDTTLFGERLFTASTPIAQSPVTDTGDSDAPQFTTASDIAQYITYKLLESRPPPQKNKAKGSDIVQHITYKLLENTTPMPSVMEKEKSTTAKYVDTTSYSKAEEEARTSSSSVATKEPMDYSASTRKTDISRNSMFNAPSSLPALVTETTFDDADTSSPPLPPATTPMPKIGHRSSLAPPYSRSTEASSTAAKFLPTPFPTRFFIDHDEKFTPKYFEGHSKSTTEEKTTASSTEESYSTVSDIMATMNDNDIDYYDTGATSPSTTSTEHSTSQRSRVRLRFPPQRRKKPSKLWTRPAYVTKTANSYRVVTPGTRTETTVTQSVRPTPAGSRPVAISKPNVSPVGKELRDFSTPDFGENSLDEESTQTTNRRMDGTSTNTLPAFTPTGLPQFSNFATRFWQTAPTLGTPAPAHRQRKTGTPKYVRRYKTTTNSLQSAAPVSSTEGKSTNALTVHRETTTVSNPHPDDILRNSIPDVDLNKVPQTTFQTQTPQPPATTRYQPIDITETELGQVQHGVHPPFRTTPPGHFARNNGRPKTPITLLGSGSPRRKIIKKPGRRRRPIKKTSSTVSTTSTTLRDFGVLFRSTTLKPLLGYVTGRPSPSVPQQRISTKGRSPPPLLATTPPPSTTHFRVPATPVGQRHQITVRPKAENINTVHVGVSTPRPPVGPTGPTQSGGAIRVTNFGARVTTPKPPPPPPPPPVQQSTPVPFVHFSTAPARPTHPPARSFVQVTTYKPVRVAASVAAPHQPSPPDTASSRVTHTAFRSTPTPPPIITTYRPYAATTGPPPVAPTILPHQPSRPPAKSHQYFSLGTARPKVSNAPPPHHHHQQQQHFGPSQPATPVGQSFVVHQQQHVFPNQPATPAGPGAVYFKPAIGSPEPPVPGPTYYKSPSASATVVLGTGHAPQPTAGEVYYKEPAPAPHSHTPGPVYYKPVPTAPHAATTRRGIEVSPKSTRITSPWEPGPTVPWGAQQRSSSTPPPPPLPPSPNSIDDLYSDYAASPDPLMQVLFQNGLTMMAGIVSEVGLDKALESDKGPFTVFAPTDKAFNEFLHRYGGGDIGVRQLKRDGRLLSVSYLLNV